MDAGKTHLRALAGWLSLWHRARGVWEARAGGTGVLALTGRGKAGTLRGYVSECVVEEAPLPQPQGEESADAWGLQQWDNYLIQGK